jgi:hypothetical protein
MRVQTQREYARDYEDYGSVLCVPVGSFTDRANHKPVQGGALNAGYTPVDALADVCNKLGQYGLVYKKDFYWEDFQYGTEGQQNIRLTFRSKDVMLAAKIGLTHD